MPVYEIQAPNGKLYQIEGPPGANDDQVRAEVLRQFPDAEKTAPKTDNWIERNTPQAVKDFGQDVATGYSRGWDQSIAEGKESWNKTIEDYKAAKGRGETVSDPMVNAIGSTLVTGPLQMGAGILDAGAKALQGVVEGTYNKVTGQGGYKEAFDKPIGDGFSGLLEQGVKKLDEVLPGSEAGMKFSAAPFVGISEAGREVGGEYGSITKAFTDLAMAIMPLKPGRATAGRNLPSGRALPQPTSEGTSKLADTLKTAEKAAPERIPEQGVLPLYNDVAPNLGQRDLFDPAPPTPRKRQGVDANMPAELVPEEAIRRQKEQAWKDLADADSEWKKITEEEAWRENDSTRDPASNRPEMLPDAEKEAMIDAKFEERRATAMESAFKAAASVERWLANLPEEHLTINRPRSGFRKSQGGWVNFAEKQRSPRDIEFFGLLPPPHQERFEIALNAVKEMFPKLYNSADGAVFYSAKMVEARNLERVRLEKKHPGALSSTIESMLNRQFPEYQKLKKDFPWALQHMEKSGEYSAFQQSKTTYGDKKAYVFFNTDKFTKVDRGTSQQFQTLAEMGATIAHELTHAFQWWVKGGDEFFAKDKDVPYFKKEAEVSARNVEEHTYARLRKALHDQMTKEERAGMTGPAPDTIWFLQKGQTRVSERYFGKAADESSNKAIGGFKSSPLGKQRGMIDPEVLGLRKLFQGWKLWYSKDGKGTELSNHLFSLPDESTADFIKRVGLPEKDMSYQVGLIPQAFRGTNTLIGDWTNQAKLTALHFLRRAESLKAQNMMENMAFETSWNGLYNAYGFNKIGKGRWNSDAFRKDIGILLDLEKNPDTWFNGKDYHASAQELVKRGMEPERAKLWEEYTKLWDDGYDSMAQAAKLAGRHVPERIPGWLPHTWEGPYAAQVVRTVGGKEVKQVWEVNSRTAKERDRMRAILEQEVKNFGDPTLSVVSQDPSWSAQTLGSTLTALRHAGERMENSKGFTALIQALELGMAKGLISSAMERSNPLKLGFELERAADKHPTRLKDADLRDAFIHLQRNVESLHDWKHRVKLITETLHPLDSAGFLDHPNLRKNIMDYLTSFTKSQEPMLKAWDEALTSYLIRFGQDPALMNSISNHINSLFAKYYLLGNASFYTVNVAQPLMVVPVLQNIKAQGMLVGESTGSVSRALANYTNNVRKGLKQSPDYLWAERRGELNAVQAELLDTTRLKDPIAQASEKWARTQSYMVSVEYFKQFMPLEKAREAAVQAMKKVQVDYSAVLGQATALSRLPVLGKPLAMFASYGQHMLGLYSELGRTLASSVKGKNVPAAATSALAGAQMVGMLYGLWGLTGVPFAQNWNDMARTVNDLFNETVFPTTERFARWMDNKMGTGTLSQFGAVSTVLNADVSGSAQGPGVALPGAGVRAYASLAALAALAWKGAKGSATLQDVYEYTQKAPPTIRAAGEWLRKYGDTTAQQDRLKKGEPRTLAEEVKMKAFGLRGINESAAKVTDRLVKEDAAHIKDQWASLLKQVKDSGGNWSQQHIRKLLDLATKYQQDPDFMITEAQNWTEGADISPEMERALRARSTNQISAYERWKKEQANGPQRAIQ